MTFNENEFLILVNDDEQYSIWQAFKAIPAGWHQVGQKGSKEACLEYIERTWTDMRPRPVR